MSPRLFLWRVLSLSCAVFWVSLWMLTKCRLPVTPRWGAKMLCPYPRCTSLRSRSAAVGCGCLDVALHGRLYATLRFSCWGGAVFCWAVWPNCPREEYVGHTHFLGSHFPGLEAAKGRLLMGFLELMKGRKALPSGGPAVVDEDTARRFPNLVEFLTVSLVGDEVRETGTINVFYDGGMFKVFLNDRHTGLYAVTSTGQLHKLLEAAEKALGSPSTDWRGQRPYKGRGQRR